MHHLASIISSIPFIWTANDVTCAVAMHLFYSRNYLSHQDVHPLKILLKKQFLTRSLGRSVTDSTSWVKDKSREETDSNKQFSGHFTPLNQCNQHAIILHWLSYVRKRCQLPLQSESFIARGLTLSDKILRRFVQLYNATHVASSTNIGAFPLLCGLCCTMFIVRRQRFFDLLVHLTFPNFAPAYWAIILEHSIGSSNNLVVAPGISSILWKTTSLLSFLHETSRNLYVLYKRDH